MFRNPLRALPVSDYSATYIVLRRRLVVIDMAASLGAVLRSCIKLLSHIVDPVLLCHMNGISRSACLFRSIGCGQLCMTVTNALDAVQLIAQHDLFGQYRLHDDQILALQSFQAVWSWL